MTATLTFVLVIILIALVFDFSNGFHDAANSIATVVSTRVLSPGVAVAWAAFFNFIAFAIYGTRVAKAIGDGININLIAPDYRLYVLLAALIGAISWNIITWYLGLPTSSSHALLGGYAGAGVAAYGDAAVCRRVRVRGGGRGGLPRHLRTFEGGRVGEGDSLHRPVAAHRAGAGFLSDGRG